MFKSIKSTWKILRRNRRGDLHGLLLQGVNLILLHSLCMFKDEEISNYFDEKTSIKYKQWLEKEVDELIKFIKPYRSEIDGE